MIKRGDKNKLGSPEIFTNKLERSYAIQHKKHQGRNHIVVPVTMMVEGVHHGNLGPILYLAEELGLIPESWNGIPVVIQHPQKDGISISANSPDVIETAVGRVYNTHMDGKKLKAEVWLDEEKLSETSVEAYEAIQNKEPLEVSVGVFSEDEEVEGEYEGEKYQKIAHNHRPDHLALLPGSVGACSWKDGCGIRANEKKGGNNVKMEINEMVEQISMAGYSVNAIGNHSEQGYQEKIRMVYDVLRSMDSEGKYHYLEELYDDALVYQISSNGESKILKQSYVTKDGKIDLVGDPIAVHKEIKYTVINDNSTVRRGKFNSSNTNNKNEEVKTMAEKAKCTPCIEKKVTALIANSQGRFTEEDDREWLQTLEETQLDKLQIPAEVKTNKSAEPEKPAVSLLTDEQKADLAWAQNERKARKQARIESIQANSSKDIWPDAVLNSMPEDHLERLYNSTKKEEPVNYVGMGGGPMKTNASTVEPLAPVGVEFKD